MAGINEDLRFFTVESSKDILEKLYGDGLDGSFPCVIRGVARHQDSVSDTTGEIYLDRTVDFSYELANEELIVRTKARLIPDGNAFDVDVIIHTRNYTLLGATVVFAPAVYEVMDELATLTEELYERLPAAARASRDRTRASATEMVSFCPEAVEQALCTEGFRDVEVVGDLVRCFARSPLAGDSILVIIEVRPDGELCRVMVRGHSHDLTYPADEYEASISEFASAWNERRPSGSEWALKPIATAHVAFTRPGRCEIAGEVITETPLTVERRQIFPVISESLAAIWALFEKLAQTMPQT